MEQKFIMLEDNTRQMHLINVNEISFVRDEGGVVVRIGTTKEDILTTVDFSVIAEEIRTLQGSLKELKPL